MPCFGFLEDHPRIRGTNWLVLSLAENHWGSSPHTRDKLDDFKFELELPRIIPAYAGQISNLESPCRLRRDHPRIRGTNRHGETSVSFNTGSSPHTRDKSILSLSASTLSRIIPAYAGQIIHPVPGWMRIWDHPRIRGTNDLG